MKIIPRIEITDAMLVSSNIVENDAPAFNMGNSYALGDFVKVVATNTHLVFQSLQNANVGHNPLLDPQTEENQPVYWNLIGSTNRWTMFDKYYNTQSSNAESIQVVLNVPGRVTAIALLNVEGKEVIIKVTDASFGVVYEKTLSLLDNSGINDYYQWFFSPIEAVQDLVVTDLPNYSNTTIEITINNAGGIAKCGALILGNWRQIGLTKQGAQSGITDYSVKKRNSFGTAQLIERDFSRWADLSLTVRREEVAKIQNILAKHRAKEVVFVGTGEDDSLIIYGFYDNLKHVITYEDYAVYNIHIEGLT